MCTVSIVPRDDGFRLVCNRDERHSRPPAQAPRRQLIGGAEAVFPTDPLGAGTWIGANDAGLAMALLNRSAEDYCPATDRPLRSRGAIIPLLLGCDTLSEAVDIASTLDARTFAPFRLLVVQNDDLATINWNGSSLAFAESTLDAPAVHTSSSLGDRVVEPPRQRLFEELVLSAQSWTDGQARFHRHQWPERPELSVRMSRPDARTVSITVIDVSSQALRFVYEDLPRGVVVH